MGYGLNLIDRMGTFSDDGGTYTLTSKDLEVLKAGSDTGPDADGGNPNALMKVNVPSGDTAYLHIDLGKICWVYQMMIWRTTGSVGDTVLWTFQYSADNSTWTTPGNASAGSYRRYASVGTYARYFRIRLNNTYPSTASWWQASIFADDTDIEWYVDGGVEIGVATSVSISLVPQTSVPDSHRLTLIQVGDPAEENGWLTAVHFYGASTGACLISSYYWINVWRYVNGYYVCTGNSLLRHRDRWISPAGFCDAILRTPLWVTAGDYIGVTVHRYGSYDWSTVGIDTVGSGPLMSAELSPIAGDWYYEGSFETTSVDLICRDSEDGALVSLGSLLVADTFVDGDPGDTMTMWLKNVALRHGEDLIIDICPWKTLVSNTLVTAETVTLLLDGAVHWPARGTVKIGTELVEYWSKVSPNHLISLTRGAGGTTPAQHGIGDIATDWHNEVLISKDGGVFYGVDDLSVAPLLTWASVSVSAMVPFYVRANLITTDELNQEFRVRVIGYFTVPGV